MDLRHMQTRLRELGHYPRVVDGEWGPHTEAAAEECVAALKVNIRTWTLSRKIVALKQAIITLDGLDAGIIDGYFGPQTRWAEGIYDKRVEQLRWRDPESTNPVYPVGPVRWPTEAEVPEFFGPVGQNQVRVELPYPLRIAWNLSQSLTGFSCHEKVRDPIHRIFSRTLEAYGITRIQELRLDLFGGCLNVRQKRGGSAWSMHSWGIAVDMDPEHNQLTWGKDRASLAQPVYNNYWRFVEDEGAISLGRTRNYDWMHFQFAR